MAACSPRKIAGRSLPYQRPALGVHPQNPQTDLSGLRDKIASAPMPLGPQKGTTWSATRAYARGPETRLRRSRPSVVPTIRADAPRILAGVAHSRTGPAAKAIVRRVEDRTASLTHRAGKADTLPMVPLTYPNQRYEFMDPRPALFGIKRIVQFKTDLSHED